MPLEWENGVAGALSGLTTVVALHPLDVVRTRFQAHNGRNSLVPTYRSTVHALLTIARSEGLKGLYAGLLPSVIGSSLSWGLYFFFYNNAKIRNQSWSGKDSGAGLHLVSAAESGVLVCLLTNPVWLVKTRLQLQPPGHGNLKPYLGIRDAVTSIVKEEGWHALYKGLGPSLLLVSHGSLQFMAYEEARNFAAMLRRSKEKENKGSDNDVLKPIDFMIAGALSKIFASTATYPYQVIRTRIQQRKSLTEIKIHNNSWQVFRDILRYEGFPGLYKGIVPNLLKNVPSSSLTFFVYETALKLLK